MIFNTDLEPREQGDWHRWGWGWEAVPHTFWATLRISILLPKSIDISELQHRSSVPGSHFRSATEWTVDKRIKSKNREPFKMRQWF